MGAGARICIRAVLWHMQGYLRCHVKLARVRGDAFYNPSFASQSVSLIAMIAPPLAAKFLGKRFQQHVGRQL